MKKRKNWFARKSSTESVVFNRQMKNDDMVKNIILFSMMTEVIEQRIRHDDGSFTCKKYNKLELIGRGTTRQK